MFYSPSARHGIAQLLDMFRPDIVHLHNIYHHLSPSILQPLTVSGVASVMTLHDFKLACPTYLFLDDGEVCEACLDGHFYHAAVRKCKGGSLAASTLCAVESTFHRATKVYARVCLFISPSHFNARKMTEAGVFPDRIRQLNNFVETKDILPKYAPGGKVVFASRVSYEKGLDVLIEAIARLGPAVRLDVAGDGPDRPKLEKFAAQMAPNQVRFLGHLPKPAVLDLIGQAAVVAIPSRCYENQPNGVLEAFACGVPVVGSNHGGIAELVDSGIDGLLIPPNDPDALAWGLRTLLSDPVRCLLLGRAGREKVERAFAPTRHLAGLESLYLEAIQQIGHR